MKLFMRKLINSIHQFQKRFMKYSKKKKMFK